MAELTTENTLPDFEPYKRTIDVPEEWRTLKGGVLNLDQINSLVQSAHLRAEKNNTNPNVELAFARQEFMSANELVDGFWTEKGTN